MSRLKTRLKFAKNVTNGRWGQKKLYSASNVKIITTFNVVKTINKLKIGNVKAVSLKLEPRIRKKKSKRPI